MLENIDEPCSDNYPPAGNYPRPEVGEDGDEAAVFLVWGGSALRFGACSCGTSQEERIKAGYGGGAGVQDEVQAAGATAGGSLPFTGLDLALLLAGGLILLVLGMFLRRAAKRTT